jgi:glycosyltransferase involved in cell wall biosynthesis
MDDFRSHFREDIAKRMRVTGYADRGFVLHRPMLNALYNAADIYLSTSAEGFGLTIAEAAACGLPIVAMDFSSVPEVVGDAGTLVPPGYLVENIYGYFWANVDEDAYTAAVEFLVNHPSRRREVGRNGPRHVASFTWAAAARQFLEIMGVREEAE